MLNDAADEALQKGLAGWLSRLDWNQKLALVGLSAALVLGPLGQGIAAAFGALFEKAAIPNTQQIEATWWLLLITLPVATPVFLVVAFWDRGNDGWVVLAVIGCIFWAVGQQETVNTKRGDLYCYAELTDRGAAYESRCRDFDEYGFLSDASRVHGPPPAQAGLLTALAFGYTVDARGLLMVFSGILAAVCIGYLVRRQTE